MIKSNDEMIKQFESFIPFVLSLNEQDESCWNSPIAEGKWTVKDIICHIMLWDKYFYEEGIQKIILNEPLTVKHLDFNTFNANAIAYAKSQTKQSIVDQFVQYRTKIIRDISGLSEDDFIKEFKDGDKKKFSAKIFLRAFIPHDKKHKLQIEKFLKASTKVLK